MVEEEVDSRVEEVFFAPNDPDQSTSFSMESQFKLHSCLSRLALIRLKPQVTYPMTMTFS